MCANKNYWFQVVEVGVEFILFACFLFSIFILFLFFGLHLVSSSFFQFPSSSCVCGPCVMCMCISRKEYVCGICVIQRCLWIPLSNKCESSIVEYKLKYGYSRNRFFFAFHIVYDEHNKGKSVLNFCARSPFFAFYYNDAKYQSFGFDMSYFILLYFFLANFCLASRNFFFFSQGRLECR